MSRAKYQREWRKRNPQKAYAYVRAWITRHPQEAKKMKHEADTNYRKENPAKILDMKKKWALEHPEQHRKTRREIKKRFYQKHRASLIEEAMLWARLNPEKVEAKRMATDLPYAPFCELCGSAESLMHHHPDYEEPLVVVTVCASCHKYIHLEETKLECLN